METHRRIARNTAALVFLRVIRPLLSVVVVLAVSRLLGTAGLGRYTLALTWFYLFNELAPLGLYALLSREGARDRARLESLLANAIPASSLAALVLTGAMAGLAYLVGYDADTWVVVAIAALGLLPSTVNNLLEASLVAVERMEYIALATLAEILLRVCGALVLLYFGYGLATVMLAGVAGYLLACVVSYVLLQRSGVRIGWRWERPVLRDLATTAPTFLLISIFATLYWRTDVFMLSKMATVEDVGFYGAAWRLLEFAMIAPQSLCLALYPRMSSARDDVGVLAGLGTFASRYLLAVGLPIAIGLTLFGGPVLDLLFGDGFRAATSTLAVLIWTTIPYGFVRYHAYLLVSADRQRIDLRLNVVLSVLNVLLNLVLIPLWGHLGAACATLASISVYGLAQIVYIRRHLPGRAAPFVVSPAPLVGAAALLTVAWSLADLGWIVALAAGGLVHLAVLWTAGFLNGDDLRVLRTESFAPTQTR